MNTNADKKWQQLRRQYPLLAMDLDALEMTQEEAELLKIIYAGLDAHDLPSVEPVRILEYVCASIEMRREIFYAKQVPEELFYSYVLPPRINNEHLDGSRGWLFGQLKERVRGKSMLDAALEVNYWCYEQATYMPTDDRTIGPRGMCRRARGRCGEESTLLASALRAVGIPARQVYVPFWAHCDDNHAWVEFWADGDWHYMGACEPEPAPDTGWFDSAASRAMLVRSRVPDFDSDSGYAIVNSTARYTDTSKLTVSVQKQGKPVTGAEVRFQVVNESRLASIYCAKTDEQGSVAFETGKGSLLVSAFFDGRLAEKPVDVRRSQFVTLNWEDGFDPLTQERTAVWELVPPDEKIPPYREANPVHQEKLRGCESIRRVYEETFDQGNSKWLKLARGNRAEIEKFLALGDYSMEDKELLLSALSEKDFADVTSEVLEDCLSCAMPFRNRYPERVWRDQILAPRVEHEMLQPVRRKLQAHFADTNLKCKNDVFLWMERHLRPVPEHGLTDRRGNACGYVRHGVCPESEWEILGVQICRALGIPAVLGPYPGNLIRLTIQSYEPLRYGENWSLAKWEAGEYRPLKPQGSDEFLLNPGSYSLITARRQIDGTINARAERFLLTEHRTIHAHLEPDRTGEKLKAVPLPEVTTESHSPSLRIYAQPGGEPTEHLLQELLELKDEFICGGWPVRFLISEKAQLDNETFRRVLQELPGCTLDYFEELEHYSVQTAMGIGDGRLPLAVVLDQNGCGVFGCANYSIRSAHTMLRILKMMDC